MARKHHRRAHGASSSAAEATTVEFDKTATSQIDTLSAIHQSIDAFLTRAQKAVDDGHLKLAKKFLTRGLQLFPDSVEALEMLGSVEMEIVNCGDTEALLADTPHAASGPFAPPPDEAVLEQVASETVERAKGYFVRAMELQPDRGHAKYLYLGQLSEGKDAIGFYQRGVEILQAELAQTTDETERTFFSRKISSALCSMTEIYMTDCCDEPEAESSCETFMTQAFNVDAFNPEVYQTWPSVKISQCQTEAAREALIKSFNLWYPNTKPGDPEFPLYPVRLSLAKLLIETSLYRHALDVLEVCQRENDEDPEGWYVVGWGNYQMAVNGKGMPDEEDLMEPQRVEHLKDAQDCFQQVLQVRRNHHTPNWVVLIEWRAK